MPVSASTGTANWQAQLSTRPSKLLSLSRPGASGLIELQIQPLPEDFQTAAILVQTLRSILRLDGALPAYNPALSCRALCAAQGGPAQRMAKNGAEIFCISS
jgi:hypothetical protein